MCSQCTYGQKYSSHGERLKEVHNAIKRPTRTCNEWALF